MLGTAIEGNVRPTRGYMVARGIDDAGDLVRLRFVEKVHMKHLLFSFGLPYVQAFLIVGDISPYIG